MNNGSWWCSHGVIDFVIVAVGFLVLVIFFDQATTLEIICTGIGSLITGSMMRAD